MATGRKEWKETGEDLGCAFKSLAKNLIRTGVAGVKMAEDWAEEDDNTDKNEEQPESTVFNDGSWRKTGKELGSAFAGLGSTIMGSVERGADKAEEWAKDVKDAMDGSDEAVADAEVVSEETID